MRAETGDDSYQFIAIRLPYGVQADESDAQATLAFIQPDVSLTINIKESTDAMVVAVNANGLTMSDFNKGNAKARMRMIAQYAIAGERKGAVIGTDHATENITGFFTKHGDGGADILPLFRLNKRQGKRLLAELGADENSTSKFLLRTWKKTSQVLLTKSHSVLPITKSTTISKAKPSTLKPKPLSKDGGTKQPTNAICQSRFLMTFGNNTLRKSKSDVVDLI